MDTYYFQIESTVVSATVQEIENVVPEWAKQKQKDLSVLIYKNHKWSKYKTFAANR